VEVSEGEDDFGKPGFDLDAHFARLMARFDADEVKPPIAGKHKYDDDDDEQGVDERKGDDGGQFDDADEEDEDDDDDDEDDDDEDDDDEDEDGVVDARRVEELRIKRAIKQYDDDYIGELDPDDPEVRGTGFNEELLDSAMDEFLADTLQARIAEAAGVGSAKVCSCFDCCLSACLLACMHARLPACCRSLACSLVHLLSGRSPCTQLSLAAHRRSLQLSQRRW
jgi:hypothetical protein